MHAEKRDEKRLPALGCGSEGASPLERLRAGEIDAHRYTELHVQDATRHLEALLSARELERVRADLRDLFDDPEVAALVKTAQIAR